MCTTLLLKYNDEFQSPQAVISKEKAASEEKKKGATVNKHLTRAIKKVV